MSPTISLASVAPISLPFSGSTDASGNFVFSAIVRVAYWSLVKVVAQAAGMGTWTISVGNGQIPLDFATGPRLSAGPFMVGPNDYLKVSLTNATPNINVIGTYWGTQHPSGESAALSAVMAPNPLTVGIPTTRALGTLIYTQGFLATQTIAIPSETLYLMLIPTPNRVGFSQLIVGGHQSGAAYYPSAGIPFLQQTSTQPILVGPIDSSDDTSIDITVQALTGGILDTFNLRVIALFSAPVDFPGQTGQFISPLPWQAPALSATIDFPLGGSATQTVIAATAGRTLYIFQINYEFDVTAATTALWQDSLSTVKLPTDQFNVDLGGGAGGGRRWPIGGVPLSIGAGLQLVNQTATAGPHLRGIVTYSAG